jgi:hypothetical protein
MGLFSDLLLGFVAVIGVVVGAFVGGALSNSIAFRYFAIFLGVVGLIIAGAGLKRRGFGGALIAGFGLGLASLLAALI